MSKQSLTVVALCLLFAAPVAVPADEQQDAAQLDQLIAKIQAALPPGWKVEFKWKGEESPRFGFDPQLIVQSVDKLPWEHVGGPGAMGRASNEPEQPPKVDPKIVELRISLDPYLSPQDYAKARERNEGLEQRRRQFELTRLKLQQGNFKGGFTPADLKPKTPEEAKLIREFAMLWIATEPQRLPTHHYGTLSFTAFDLHSPWYGRRKIYQPAKDKEYQQIIATLEKLLVPYEKPADSAVP